MELMHSTVQDVVKVLVCITFNELRMIFVLKSLPKRRENILIKITNRKKCKKKKKKEQMTDRHIDKYYNGILGSNISVILLNTKEVDNSIIDIFMELRKKNYWSYQSI